MVNKVGTTLNSIIAKSVYSIATSVLENRMVLWKEVESIMEEMNKEIECFDWIETNTGLTFYKKESER